VPGYGMGPSRRHVPEEPLKVVLIGAAGEVVKRYNVSIARETVSYHDRVFLQAFVSHGGEMVYVEDAKVMNQIPGDEEQQTRRR
jgi:hypothetical protein